MEAFELSRLARTRRESGKLYLEFLKHESLSMGLYELSAGGADPQSPHTEDEVYVVLEGSGVLEVEGESTPLSEGMALFVAAGAEHRFSSYEQLALLVVFNGPHSG